MKRQLWEKSKWYGTNNIEILKQFTSYKLKFKKGFIWLLVYNKPYFLDIKYHFVSSQGANSDNSFSGLLTDNNLTLEQAQLEAYQEVYQYCL